MEENIFDRVAFTQENKNTLESLYKTLSSVEIITQNAANVVLRTKATVLSGDLSTFVLTTSAHSDDEIIYLANTDIAKLN